MPTIGTISVLCVGQDNLFAEVPGCIVDYIPTGGSITPFAVPGKSTWRRWPAVLAGVCLGKYDVIVLPAIDFHWQHDASPIKRVVRSMAWAVSRFQPVSACANRLLARRDTRVILLDRYDSHEPLVDSVRYVTSARYYFKANLAEMDRGRLCSSGRGSGCRFKYLPSWIAIENYQVPFQRDKDIDVFFAGAVNCEQRRVSIDTVQQLQREGYRIKTVEGHLPFAEYLSLMSRSWMTLSPQGYGYNGFRHYESMLVGSVPLINRPDPPIVNDFRHGDNCFLYSTTQGDLNDVIKTALSDKSRLLQMAEGLREYVVGRHSMRAVGEYLLRQALGDRENNGHETEDAREPVAPIRKADRRAPANVSFIF